MSAVRATQAAVVSLPFLSARGRAWRALACDRYALVGGGGVLLFVGLALLAPLVSPYDPNFQHPAGLSQFGQAQPPGRSFLLGTDLLGRDLLSRVIWCARVSLAVGLLSTIIALAVAVGIGLAAGYFSGPPRTVLLWIINAVLSFPTLLLMLALVSVLPRGIWVVIFVLSAFAWAYPARVIAGGLGLPAKGFIIPQIACYDDRFTGVPPYDPARAKALLTEAGVAGGFSVNLDVATTGSMPFSGEWAQVLQQSFAQVGIRAEIRRFTGGVLSRMLSDDASVLALNGWGASFLDPVDHLGTLVASDGFNARRVRYRNAEVDILFAQAERTASPDVRCRLYQRINRLALDDLPIIPLVVTRRMHLRSPRIGTFVWHRIYDGPIFEEISMAR